MFGTHLTFRSVEFDLIIFSVGNLKIGFDLLINDMAVPFRSHEHVPHLHDH